MISYEFVVCFRRNNILRERETNSALTNQSEHAFSADTGSDLFSIAKPESKLI